MKYLYFLLFTLFICFSSQAQIVNIPDANFKNALLNYPIVIDTNGDGEIQLSEAASFVGSTSDMILSLYDMNISDLTGIDAFTSVKYLVCTSNSLTTLEFAYNEQLSQIFCGNNLLTSIDVSGLPNLISLDCDVNNLTELDTSNNPLLVQLVCNDNQMTSLDISQNSSLETFVASNNQLTTVSLPEGTTLRSIHVDNNNLTNLDISNYNTIVSLEVNGNQLSQLDVSNQSELFNLNADNNQLNSIFLKNGNQLNDFYLSFDNNPNLEYICADVFEFEQIENKLLEYGNTDVVVNPYCTFVPGGEVFVVQGACRLDFDEDGCDSADPIYPFSKFLVSNGTTQEYFFSDSNGYYEMPLQEGNFTITPILENLNYFNVSPSVVAIDLPSTSNPYIQEFCLLPDGIRNDLEVYIIPLGNARPGFEVDYKVIYKNNGNTIMTGSVEFNFDADYVEFLSATQNPDIETYNSLTWYYAGLQPFENREITVSVNLNTPTDPDFPLNGGDQLGFQSVITPIIGDDNEEDNITSIKHQVVNSFDPNDKTCLEGDTITPEMVGEYVHYLIRFENTGTADAINIVVKDVIDTAKFDISKLIPLHGSHEFVTRIKNTNEVEFIFENINLPFDDANNDGYVTFKIKTLPTLTLGDTFANDAEIYFDYNAPIITNDFLTTVAEPLSVNESNSNSFKFYPNPVIDELFIESKFGIHSATVYDLNGRLLNSIAFTDHAFKQAIDVSQFSKGIYFIRIKSDGGEVTEKIIKE